MDLVEVCALAAVSGLTASNLRVNWRRRCVRLWFVLTEQLFIHQASSSSLQVVFGEGVGAQQVAKARRRQLLLQVMQQLLRQVFRHRQTDQSQVFQLCLLVDRGGKAGGGDPKSCMTE